MKHEKNMSTIRRIFAWDRSCGILNVFVAYFLAYVLHIICKKYAKHMQKISKKKYLGMALLWPKDSSKSTRRGPHLKTQKVP